MNWLQQWVDRMRPAPSLVDELNLVGSQVRTSLLGWGALALGIASAVFVADEVSSLEHATQDAQTQWRRLERAEQRARLNKAIANHGQERKTDAPPLQEVWVEPAAKLAAYLAFPWATVLAQIESTAVQESAVLMSFALDLDAFANQPGGFAEARLTAAVLDDDLALRWAAGHPGGQLHGRERLTEPFTTSTGRYALRAETSISLPFREGAK